MLPPWLIKTAIGQALKPENQKRILLCVGGIICAILLLVAVILQPLSFLTGENITTDFDITASAAYKEIYPVYEEYITELLEVLNQKAEDVKEQHKKWIKEYERDPQTGERVEAGGHWEYPDVEVITPEPPLAALFAWLSQNNEDILKARRYQVNAQEIKDFFNSIYEFEVTGSDMSYTVAAHFLTDTEIAEKYYPESEASRDLFAQSIALINDFLAAAGYVQIGGELNLSASAVETLTKIYNAFIEQGYSKAAAAGACGNIQQECNFNYTLGPPAYGIIQWTGSRFKALQKHAIENNYNSWNVLEAQIEFMFHELNGTYQSRLSSYSSKYADAAQYKDIQDPREAAFVFCAVYEGCEYNPDKGWGKPQGSTVGPDGKRWQQLEYRQNYAEKIYNAFSGGNSSMGQVANGSSSEKLAALFPSGLPNSSAAADRYMERIPIEVWDGSKKVTKYVTLHRALKEDIQEIFSEIAAAHIPLKSVSGYSWRGMNNGGSGSRSHHSYGVALDIDPDFNPSGKYSRNPVGVKPDISCYYYKYPWQPKVSTLSISPESVIVRAFENHGWVWGAKWGTVSRPTRGPYDPGYHDFMHFSFTGH